VYIFDFSEVFVKLTKLIISGEIIRTGGEEACYYISIFKIFM